MRVSVSRLALVTWTLGLLGAWAAAEDPSVAMLGQPAPSFRLEDVRTGEIVSLEDFRGRFVVLHFGASW